METKNIIVGKFIVEAKDDGTFLYKGITPSKKEKGLYKEKPQFPLIEKYENVAKERYKEDLRNTVIKIVELVKTL